MRFRKIIEVSKSIQDYFNSSMVRLKDGLRMTYGEGDTRFNSSMVRLKVRSSIYTSAAKVLKPTWVLRGVTFSANTKRN